MEQPIDYTLNSLVNARIESVNCLFTNQLFQLVHRLYRLVVGIDRQFKIIQVNDRQQLNYLVIH